MNVGEAEVSALETVGELFVVEAKEMEESRVEVVDVDFSIDYAEATARNLLLEERSRKPGFGGIHGGERGLLKEDPDERINLDEGGVEATQRRLKKGMSTKNFKRISERILGKFK